MTFPQIDEDEFPTLDACEAVFREGPAAMALIAPRDDGCRLALANAAFEGLFGSNLEGLVIERVFRGAGARQMKDAVAACLLDGKPLTLRIAHAPAGEVVRLRTDLRRIDLEGQTFVLAMVSDQPLQFADMSETGLLAELSALSRGLVYIRDVPRDILRYGTHPLAKRLGLGPGVVDIVTLHGLVHPEDAVRYKTRLADQGAAEDDRVHSDSYRMRAVNDEWLWINLRSRVLARDAAGRVQQVIGVATDVTQAHDYSVAMEAAATALAHAEINERRRIGRELHDSTVQQLVAARLGLNTLERRTALTPETQRLLDEIRQSVASAQHEIRNFSYMLHPPSLQEEGLERTLRAFVIGFARRTGLDVSVRVSRGAWRLPFAVEVALFRVTQEALMNVYRHAKAQRAAVRLKRQAGEVVLEVEDDGVGLPADQLAKRAGVGISGMQARMTQLGGAFELSPGAVGLKVRASVAAARPEL